MMPWELPASYTSGQSSLACRHSTCWASSQRSHTVSSTPCHGAWTSARLSGHLSIECKRTAPPIETPICKLPVAQQLISSSDNNNIRAAQWADHQWNTEWLENTTRPRIFIPDTGTHPLEWLSQRAWIAWVRLNRLRTGVGRFRSCLYKWSMASSATCECGAEEQTVDHVVLPCPIHRPPHGTHDLIVLDDETIEWLLKVSCGQAVN